MPSNGRLVGAQRAKPAPPLASTLRAAAAVAGQLPPQPPLRPGRARMTVSAGPDGEQTISGGFSPLTAVAATTGTKNASPILTGSPGGTGQQRRTPWHGGLLSPLGGGGSSVRILSSDAPLPPSGSVKGGGDFLLESGLESTGPNPSPLLPAPLPPPRLPIASLSLNVAAAAASIATGAAVGSTLAAGGTRPLPVQPVGIRAGDPSLPEVSHVTSLPLPADWVSLLKRTAAALAEAGGAEGDAPPATGSEASAAPSGAAGAIRLSSVRASRAQALFAGHNPARRIPSESFEQVRRRKDGWIVGVETTTVFRAGAAGGEQKVLLAFGGMRRLSLACVRAARGM